MSADKHTNVVQVAIVPHIKTIEIIDASHAYAAGVKKYERLAGDIGA
jgi:hypothetical protein